MNAIHDFEQQASLESFLFHLQQLCPDSLLYVYDDIAQTWIYEYAQDASVSAATGKTLKNQLLKLKLQSQSASQPQTGLLQLPNSAKAWHYHSLNIRVHTADFTGCLFFLQPSVATVSSQTLTPSAQAQNSLAEFFHSDSPQMQHMYSIIERVAITEFPVLVRGESGSGKELVAQAVHARSQRHAQVFIAINCAALNANILESELFGHVKGAFTGAIREHKGVFERAAGGTLFLDEIAEIPLELQAKLLRVLETG